MVEFAQPAWLALLAVLPAVAFSGWRAARTSRRLRPFAASLLRCLALGALIAALAGPLASSYSRHADVVFALDVSHSLDREALERGLAFVNRALVEKDPQLRMGLVVFGADAAVERLVGPAPDPVTEIAASVDRGGTNIGRALEVALGAMPAGGEQRVVLLSDGRENLGRAVAAAGVARAIGVEVSAIALEKTRVAREVYVEHMVAPPTVRVSEPFEVQVTVHSNAAARAQLVLLRNGMLLHERELALQPGRNTVAIADQSESGGLYEYEAVVNAAQDGVVENNRYQTFVRIIGPPRVLHATGQPGWDRYVSEALRAQGLLVDEIPGSALPASEHRLFDYDLLILNNVPGFDLSFAKMALLEDYVRDAGGGLISLGGDKSYSAGGYYGTPVERLLPVTMDVRTDAKIPSLAVVVLIDTSGSMASQSGGEEKLAIAKSAALAAIEVLNPLDRVGVLAFDAGQTWNVAPTRIDNRRAIADKLGSLRAGGGTDLFGALREAHRVLVRQRAKVKHLIVLSDGLTNAADFEGLGRRIVADGVTVSTVAFGDDADLALLRSIAARGKGRFYHTDDPRNIPRIFTSETLVVSRKPFVEQPTAPALDYPGEILAGFRAEDFPLLDGYQRTFAKPAAQVLLRAGTEDPLLVAWRYGLGKSVAFTSDLAGRWGQRWVDWPEFGRFVAQMARWTMRRGGAEKLQPTFRWQGRRGELLLDVLDRDDRFVNGLALEGLIVDPARNDSRVTLEQVAPGRYRADFAAPRSGRYYVSLNAATGDVGEGTHAVGPTTFGFAIPYSPEYLDLGVDETLLATLARDTGGRMLPLSGAALPFITEPRAGSPAPRFRIWWPLFVAALVLLVLEIAVRKLAVPQTWLARWRRPGSEREPRAEPGYDELVAGIERARSEHLQALREGSRDSADDPAARARLYVAGAGRRGR